MDGETRSWFLLGLGYGVGVTLGLGLGAVVGKEVRGAIERRRDEKLFLPTTAATRAELTGDGNITFVDPDGSRRVEALPVEADGVGDPTTTEEALAGDD